MAVLTNPHELENLRAKVRALEELMAVQEAVVVETSDRLEAALADLQTNNVELQQLKEAADEIRTPMNGIMGMTELALGTEVTEEQRVYLDTVQECATALLDLINDILDLSKVEAGKLSLESVDFDLLEMAEKVADVVAHRAAKAQIELICDIDSSLPRHVRGDPTRLRQVLLNLLSNAFKFTERGEVELRVSLESITASEANVRFSVRDTGIGIPAERQQHIFEAFTQADGSTTRKYGGTGLGLTISRQFVRLMGADILLQSAPGEGSTFSFQIRLPYSREPLAAGQPCPAATGDALRGKRILVVDDNATNRLVLQGMLELWGAQPILVAGGPEALAAVSQTQAEGNPFHLILLDVQMPIMDGYSVAKELARDPVYGRPTVVFVSSIVAADEFDPAARNLAAGYLAKPVKRSALWRAICAAPPGETLRSSQLVAAGPQRLGRTLRVLVVDDNTVNRKVARGVLQKQGCEVVEAEDGQQAIDKIEQEPFDIVLMDVQMPVMDGLEATRKLRADSRWRDLPIIAMTAHAMKGDREACLASGMNDYISKPIRLDEMRDTIAKWSAPLAAK